MLAQIATFIYKQILNSKHKLSFKIYAKLRTLLLRFIDPLITLKFRGYTLSMPFSHTIFINQKLYPTYDMQLHKIAHYIAQKMGSIHIIEERTALPAVFLCKREDNRQNAHYTP